VDRQARVRAVRPAGYDEVDRCVLLTARRPSSSAPAYPPTAPWRGYRNTDGPVPEDPGPGRRCRSATARRGLRRAAGVLSGP
jgi:hypothetical protein